MEVIPVKKWMMFLLTIALFTLTACGSNEEQELKTDDTEELKTDDTVSKNDSQTTEKPLENSSTEEQYTAAEQCIMSQLTECKDVETAKQFQAYQDLVADETLAQAPGSGCLSCAVKYSFEMKYGESNPINTVVLPRSQENPEDMENVMQYVQQYLFALPAYFNNENEDALNFYQPESIGYNTLSENKISGNFSNHMTYSVFIDSEEINPDGSTSIYAYRMYSHTNTNGVYESYNRYNVIESNGRYYLTSFEELDNVRVE